MGKYIISADTVLPVSREPLHGYSVVVTGQKISDIGPSSEMKKLYPDHDNLELGTGILLPGFINCHTHLELGWTKPNMDEFQDFTGWLENLLRAKSINYDESEIADSVKSGISELIRCGVSTVGEISSYNGIDIPILCESGIRTIIFRELLDSNYTHPDPSDFGSAGELTEIRPFPHAPYSCCPELISSVIELSAEYNIPFSMHLAESNEELKFVRKEENRIESIIYKMINKKKFARHRSDTPLNYILDGFEDTDKAKMTFVHMVNTTEDDFIRLKAFDIGVVMCPRSNLFLKVGEPPVDILCKLDRIGLGTDGISSNYNLDFFEELRCLHKICYKHMGSDSSRFCVYTATLGGARALFIENTTGSIDSDKAADLIFIKKNKQVSDPYDEIIRSAGNDVGFVMINGKIITNNLS